MASRSSTPLWDDLSQKTIARLFTDAPGFEFLILKAHLLVEHALDLLIDVAPRRPLPKTRGRGWAKLKKARALGVLPEIYIGPLTALNTVRNNIAHVDAYAVTVDDLLTFLLPDNADIAEHIQRDFESDPTDATRTAVVLLTFRCLELVGEHEQQAHERRKP